MAGPEQHQLRDLCSGVFASAQGRRRARCARSIGTHVDIRNSGPLLPSLVLDPRSSTVRCFSEIFDPHGRQHRLASAGHHLPHGRLNLPCTTACRSILANDCPCLAFLATCFDLLSIVLRVRGRTGPVPHQPLESSPSSPSACQRSYPTLCSCEPETRDPDVADMEAQTVLVPRLRRVVTVSGAPFSTRDEVNDTRSVPV